MSVSVTDLCVHYGDYCALHHFDLATRPGDFVAIVGPNGGGKTTLMRALLGLQRSAHGELTIDGRVAYVSQEAIHMEASPISVLEFATLGRVGRRFWQRTSEHDRARVEEALRETGVWDLRHQRLSSLSGGQRQRVHLAQALCQDVQVLLLDEPTSGMDPKSRDDLYQLLRHLCDDHAITAIMISHDSGSLHGLVDRVVVVDKTKRFEGTPDAFLEWTQPTQVSSENPFWSHA